MLYELFFDRPSSTVTEGEIYALHNAVMSMAVGQDVVQAFAGSPIQPYNYKTIAASKPDELWRSEPDLVQDESIYRTISSPVYGTSSKRKYVRQYATGSWSLLCGTEGNEPIEIPGRFRVPLTLFTASRFEQNTLRMVVYIKASFIMVWYYSSHSYSAYSLQAVVDIPHSELYFEAQDSTMPVVHIATTSLTSSTNRTNVIVPASIRDMAGAIVQNVASNHTYNTRRFYWEAGTSYFDTFYAYDSDQQVKLTLLPIEFQTASAVGFTSSLTAYTGLYYRIPSTTISLNGMRVRTGGKSYYMFADAAIELDD